MDTPLDMPVTIDRLTDRIYTLRGVQVMIDSDLATAYNVPVKVFNQAVIRNLSLFPASLRFQLTNQELAHLRSQIVTSSDEKVSINSIYCVMRSRFATGSGVVKKRVVRSAALSEMEQVGDGMIRENLAGLEYVV